jgi:hypothetical protein
MDFDTVLVALLFWLPINLLVGGLTGRSKGRVGEGIALALLLGPIGWLILFLGSDQRRKCLFCAEPIQEEARICPHCHKDVSSDGYLQWKRERDQERMTVIEDPVEKWAREHPEEANK